MQTSKRHTASSLDLFRNLVLWLERVSSRPDVTKSVYLLALGFFLIIIIAPAIAGILAQLYALPTLTLSAEISARIQSAIAWSFVIGFVVALLDLLAGVPLAWLIVRRRGRWITILDSLADIPFVIPTVALGFSILEFWTGPDGISKIFGGASPVSPGAVLIILLHFAFSFPVIVRVMVGEFLNYQETFEVAARTLGAPAFTAVRTVTFPMLRLGLLAAFLLALARSLSETGATIVVAGAFETGVVFIKNARDANLNAAVLTSSLVLIAASLLMFTAVKIVSPKLKIMPLRGRPNFERKLSTRGIGHVRDSVSLFIFFLFVLLPCLFIAFPAFGAVRDGMVSKAVSGVGPWSPFWSSMLLSYVVALLATFVNIVSGLPIAVLVARNKLGNQATKLVDALIDLPIIVPSLALGVSLNFFWSNIGALPEFWVIVFAHTTITYSYFVRAMAASIQGIAPELEEAAKTLGALPLRVFRKITLPLTKYSLLSGAILMFTRSVDETGATLAVSQTLKTAPVLLVGWIRGSIQVTPPERALGIAFLVATSFLALVVLRILAIRKPKRLQ